MSHLELIWAFSTVHAALCNHNPSKHWAAPLVLENWQNFGLRRAKEEPVCSCSWGSVTFNGLFEILPTSTRSGSEKGETVNVSQAHVWHPLPQPSGMIDGRTAQLFIITWHCHSFIRSSCFRLNSGGKKTPLSSFFLCLLLAPCSHLFWLINASSSDVRWRSKMAYSSETSLIFESTPFGAPWISAACSVALRRAEARMNAPHVLADVRCFVVCWCGLLSCELLRLKALCLDWAASDPDLSWAPTACRKIPDRDSKRLKRAFVSWSRTLIEESILFFWGFRSLQFSAV